MRINSDNQYWYKLNINLYKISNANFIYQIYILEKEIFQSIKFFLSTCIYLKLNQVIK